MITIVKGNDKIVCSYDTYDTQYRNLGYRLASDEKKEAEKQTASSFEEKVEKLEKEEDEKEKLSEKYGLKKKSTTAKKEKEEK